MAVDTASLDRLFGVTLRPAIDLIAIHKRKKSVGRRVADLSLNRGAVVFTVAAWQAYVEALTKAIMAEIAPPATDPLMRLYLVLADNVREKIQSFSTPNVKKTLTLLALVGFDPTPAWAFAFEWERQTSTLYGSLKSRRTLTKAQVKTEINGWLQVRHKLAHGDRLPVDPERVTGSDKGNPQLTRQDADRCVNFFQAVVRVTSKEVAKAYP